MNFRQSLFSALGAAVFSRSPTHEGLAALQGKALRRLVAHAYDNVPHYRRLFDRHGIHPRDIQTLSDLEILPITTKDDLRGGPVEDTLARGTDPDRLMSIRTGGTSGTPFTVRRTRLEHRILLLSWVRALRHFGRKRSDRLVAVLYVRPGFVWGGGLQQRLRNLACFYPSLTMDMGLQPEQILEAIRRYRPGFVGGYPGVLSRVVELITERDRSEFRPKAIWVGGEVLTEPMRHQISRGFGARVYNCYASEEFGLIAWECGETGELHVYADNVILEVLKDGRPAAPGERGEVVGTNLLAYAMPFIRYRLGDIVTRGPQACACGQPFPTIRDIQGRVLDYFTLPDGRLLHPYDITRIVLREADWIRYHELVQERRDRIVLRVVPYGSPPQEALRRLEKAMAPVLSPGVEFHVILVAEIRPDASDKFRFSRSLVGTRGAERQ